MSFIRLGTTCYRDQNSKQGLERWLIQESACLASMRTKRPHKELGTATCAFQSQNWEDKDKKVPLGANEQKVTTNKNQNQKTQFHIS